MRHASIKTKFLVPAVSLVIAGFALVIWLNSSMTRTSMETMLKESMTLINEGIAKDVGGDIGITLQMLSVWADEDSVRSSITSGEAAEAVTHFRRILKKLDNKTLQYINIFNLKGDLLGTTAEGSNAKVNVADRDYFKAIVEGKNANAIGKAIKSRTTGKKVIILSQSVVDSKGALIGVLTAAIDLDSITAQVNAMKIGSTGYVAILEKSGMTVAHPNAEFLLKDDIAKTDLGQKALAVEEQDYFQFKDGTTRAVSVRKDKATGWTYLVFAPLEDVQSAASSMAQKSLMVGGGIAIVLAAFIIWLINTTIAKPINRCVDFASAVAEGELGKELAHSSNDELGRLADALRHMVTKLKEGIEHLGAKEAEATALAKRAEDALEEARIAQTKADAARSQGLKEAADKMNGVVMGVEGASKELSKQVMTIENGADTQRARTTETATAMDEMNATILEISRNASMASSEADRMRETAKEGKTVVSRAVEAIGAVHAVSARMREQMSELGQSVQGIGKILDVINDIADQTNLLALNAAIEAARAGDAGRGFAVVADEVRKLAEKTMIATKEVGSAISTVQNGARQNIDNVNQATAAIEEANRLADASIVSLEQVLTLSGTTSDQIRSIATAAEQQSGASGEIDHAVKDIMTIAANTMESVEECRKTMDQMSGLANELKRILEDLTA